MAVDWASIRLEFPALDRWTFLNTATCGQLPLRAQQAMSRHLERRDQHACADLVEWFDDADSVRASAARLINCAPSDIAFIPNASTALSLVVGGIDWQPGDRMVTLSDEFPNHLYFSDVLARRGAEFVETSWDRLSEAVDERTRLVAFSTVNYTSGFRAPLAEAARIASARGALLYLDGTQSAGALRVDVSAIQSDVYAVDAYKWLLSPMGAGFMYVSPRLRERLAPNVIGWRSHKEWRDFGNLHHGAPQFSDTAEKYEGGMLNFPSLYAMGASIEMILEIGPAEIEARVLELAGKLRVTLRGLGAYLPGDEAPHFDSPIVAARFQGQDAGRLVRALKDRRVLISARHGNLRVSTHFYNSEEDLERLECVLRTLLN
jgi:cysteine desulfurase / selenocysteine lyase